MKRHVLVWLALVMLTGFFSGCQGGNEQVTSETDQLSNAPSINAIISTSLNFTMYNYSYYEKQQGYRKNIVYD